MRYGFARIATAELSLSQTQMTSPDSREMAGSGGRWRAKNAPPIIWRGRGCGRSSGANLLLRITDRHVFVLGCLRVRFRILWRHPASIDRTAVDGLHRNRLAHGFVLVGLAL